MWKARVFYFLLCSLSPFLPLCAFQALSYFLGNGEGGPAPGKFTVRRGRQGQSKHALPRAQSPLMSSCVQNTRRTKKVTLGVCVWAVGRGAQE